MKPDIFIARLRNDHESFPLTGRLSVEKMRELKIDSMAKFLIAQCDFRFNSEVVVDQTLVVPYLDTHIINLTLDLLPSSDDERLFKGFVDSIGADFDLALNVVNIRVGLCLPATPNFTFPDSLEVAAGDFSHPLADTGVSAGFTIKYAESISLDNFRYLNVSLYKRCKVVDWEQSVGLSFDRLSELYNELSKQ